MTGQGYQPKHDDLGVFSPFVKKKLPSKIVIAPKDCQYGYDDDDERICAGDARILESKYGYLHIPMKLPDKKILRPFLSSITTNTGLYIELYRFLVESEVEDFKKKTGIKEIKPFITDLRFICHGNDFANKPNSPAQFKFGLYDPNGLFKATYTRKDLRELRSGIFESFLERNAQVYLDGCGTAYYYPRCDKFLCEVGRVFFGNKSGRVLGNTTMYSVPGGYDPIEILERKGSSPRPIRWPEECQGIYKEMIRLPSS